VTKKVDKWAKTAAVGQEDNLIGTSLKHYKLVKALASGGTCEVFLARFKASGNDYALKVMRKSHLIANDMQKNVMQEQEMMKLVRHPFVVNLRASFQDPKNLYLVMDLVPGGELFGIMPQDGMPMWSARFYASEILIAMEYVHSQGVVFRDLKPENVLIDGGGHVKLTDFGFAKQLTTDVHTGLRQRAQTWVGTPEYMAPEILNSQGYDEGVDWWALGVLIYELLTGASPFLANTQDGIFANITKGRMTFPDWMDKTTKQLISGLLTEEPSQRLGTQPMGGPAALKKHPWFRSIDWVTTEKRQIIPPQIPNAPPRTNLGFTTEAEDLEDWAEAFQGMAENEDPSVDWSKYDSEFIGF